MSTPPPYQGSEPYVFVCYSHADDAEVLPQVRWLDEQGIRVWYDERISPGEEWSEELGRAIEGASHLLFWASANSASSRHCRDEIHFALTREKRIVAVHLEPTTLPVGLELAIGSTQAIPAYKLPKPEWREKLLRALSTNGGYSTTKASTAVARRGPLTVAVRTVLTISHWVMQRWLLITGIVLALIVSAVLQQWARTTSPGAAEPVRMHVNLPRGVGVTSGVGYGASALALSPDGRTVVIAGTEETGRRRLYARPLDRFEAFPIDGTDGASAPFFSPDGDWIGFFADGRLKRIPIAGGAPVDIAVTPGFPAGASWAPDGRIAFVSGARSWLHEVDVRGGEVKTLAALTSGEERGHYRPAFLPDGRTLLFDSGSRIRALDLASGRRTTITEGVAPSYVQTGHLVFARDATLLAAPFDASRLAMTGPALPVAEGVALERPTVSGTPHYAVSLSGDLAYVWGTSDYRLILRGSDGTEEPISQLRPVFENPRFSPGGERLAVAVGRRAGEPTDIWIYELNGGAGSRLTFDGGRAPVWRPDGSAVTYSHLGERQGIYTKSADGRGEAELVIPVGRFHWLVGWTPDGETLAFGRPEGSADDAFNSSIVALNDGQQRRVVGPGQIWGGRLSPNGQWLAYYTLEAGRFEVYVTPFPNGGTRWLISDEGGTDPSWGSDGEEIYYRSGDRLLAARIDMTAGVRVVQRRLITQPFLPPAFDDYHEHPDDQSLVLVRPAPRQWDVLMVLNWTTELRGRVDD